MKAVLDECDVFINFIVVLHENSVTKERYNWARIKFQATSFFFSFFFFFFFFFCSNYLCSRATDVSYQVSDVHYFIYYNSYM